MKLIIGKYYTCKVNLKYKIFYLKDNLNLKYLGEFSNYSGKCLTWWVEDCQKFIDFLKLRNEPLTDWSVREYEASRYNNQYIDYIAYRSSLRGINPLKEVFCPHCEIF